MAEEDYLAGTEVPDPDDEMPWDENNNLVPEVLPAPLHNPPAVINKQTGEIQQVAGSRGETIAMMVVPLGRMKEIIDYVEDMRNKILKKDVDYGLVPGTKKPSILKAGVEKLEFAFMLTTKIKAVHAERDWDARWEYESYDKDGFITKKQAQGDITVTVTIGVYLRGSEFLVCEAVGTCSRRERGRELAPENTLVKMAMKRAKASGVLEATFSSDRFTVDVDTYSKEEVGPSASGPKQSSGQSSEGGSKMRTLRSKYGTADKPSKCNFCGRSHILIGDELCLAPETCSVPAFAAKWGSVDCYKTGLNSPTNS